MAKKKNGKQTKGGGSLRKAMRKAGAFRKHDKGKPQGPPGEIKPQDPKNE